MRGAAALGLHEHLQIGEFRARIGRNIVMLGADHDGYRRALRLLSAVSTCPSSERPATLCSTFGREDRIRVPSPAASTIVRQVRPLISIPFRSRRS